MLKQRNLKPRISANNVNNNSNSVQVNIADTHLRIGIITFCCQLVPTQCCHYITLCAIAIFETHAKIALGFDMAFLSQWHQDLMAAE